MARGEVSSLRTNVPACAIHVSAAVLVLQAFAVLQRRKVSLEEWKRKLAAVKVRKEDMNNLIMNFLVTEVRLFTRLILV